MSSRAPGSSDPDDSPRQPLGLFRARAASRPPGRHPGQRESSLSDHPARTSSSTASTDRPEHLARPIINKEDSDDDDRGTHFLDQPGDLRRSSPYLEPGDWTFSPNKIIDIITPIVSSAEMDTEGPTFDSEDWEDLKDLFSKATELHEDHPAEAMPTLRGVMHECHRFMRCYEDPAVFFAERTAKEPGFPSDVQRRRSPFSSSRKPWVGSELPTAFHSILGTALYIMGNMVHNDRSLLKDGEPDNPVFYWAYALDVFETGDTLPCRTGPDSYDAPEDWSLAMFWGRTIICLAEETADRLAKAKQLGDEYSYIAPLAQFARDVPAEWPKESPFYLINIRRPISTQRTSLENASPHDLLKLAMDHLSRGIFHMPHPQKTPSVASSSSSHLPSGLASGRPSCHPVTFSRPRELFNIAYDMLALSDRLDDPQERQEWASAADSFFEQMKNEAELPGWRAQINSARGRCWLVFGSAGAVMLEPALERGKLGVLESEEAQDARDGLVKSIGFFERAADSATVGNLSEAEILDIKKMLVESLLTLANLTPNNDRREELYARAQAEGTDCDFDMDLEDEDHIMSD